MGEHVESGEVNRTEAIDRLKAIAWMRNTYQPLRLAAIEELIAPGGLLTDTQGIVFAAGLLPTERDSSVRRLVVSYAAEKDWKELTPALVRSLSKPDPAVPDTARPEYVALARLHPDRTIEEIVFTTFVEESEPGVTRLRRDSWNLLSRLDATGELRIDLLTSLLSEEEAAADDALGALRAGLLDFRTIPLTGEELEWLTDLYTAREGAGRQWWGDVRSTIAALDQNQRRGLRLRHLEALRWASRNKSEWLAASRSELLADLTRRLDNREHRRRVSDVLTFRSETLDAWQDQMNWADVLTALVVDDTVMTERVRGALFEQAEVDREDTTTEYGGIIRISIRPNEPDVYVAADYPPKPVMRESDTSFVASPEMFREGTRALAHYHFHVQKVKNGQYAGPSYGDMRYAQTYGRACLVFTSLDEDVMGVDLYQPDGVIIDLGMIQRP